jgi:hypothetical protein
MKNSIIYKTINQLFIELRTGNEESKYVLLY